VSDFGRLQRFVKEGRPGDLTYIAFDLLFEDGEDLRALPLVERKRRLEQLLRRGGQAVHGVVRYGDHIEGLGGDVFAEACLQGLEGVVSKRAGDTYAAGAHAHGSRAAAARSSSSAASRSVRHAPRLRRLPGVDTEGALRRARRERVDDATRPACTRA
jgi:hypothetical protein